MTEHNQQVLELGGGSGTNFGFVKEPVHWIVTEPNPAFVQYFQENVKKNGGDHHISELIEVSGHRELKPKDILNLIVHFSRPKLKICPNSPMPPWMR